MRTSPRASPPPRPPCSFHIAPLPPSRIRSRDSLPATCPAQHPLPVPTPAAQTHRSPPKTPPSQQPTNSLVFSSSFPLLPKALQRILPATSLGKILHRLLDQTCRPRIRIAGAIPLHRKISFIAVLFRNPKRLRQIHVRDFILPIAHFGFFHVRNAVRESKHPLDSLVRILVVARCQRISEIRQRVQPLAAHFFNDLHQKKRIFADRIVVLQIHHHILRCAILRHALQTFRRPLHVRFRILRLRNVCPHARRADRPCCINPSLAERDSALPLRAVRGIRAVLAVHRNVHDRSARLRHRRAQLLEVRLLQRTKMRAPRFDFLDVEFRANVRRELFQLHLSAASLVRAPRDEVPEWVRRNRNSFARRRRKLQARSRIRRKHRLHSRGQLQRRS